MPLDNSPRREIKVTDFTGLANFSFTIVMPGKGGSRRSETQRGKTEYLPSLRFFASSAVRTLASQDPILAPSRA